MADNLIDKMGQPIDPITGTPDFYNENPAFRPKVKETYESFRAPDMRQQLGQVFEPLGGVKDIDVRLHPSQFYDIPEARAKAQTGAERTGNFFAQLANEAVLGGFEALGYVMDFEELGAYEEQAQEGFSNWFSDIFRNAKESIHEEFPIYQTRAAMEGSLSERLGEPSFYAAQGRTIGTTLSLMLPSLAAAGLISTGVGAVGGGAMLTSVLGGMGAAMFSRKAESAMEAFGAFEENYNKFLQEGLTEDAAREKAGVVAAGVHKANAAMLPIDMLQYMTLLKPFKAFATAKDAMVKTAMGKVGSAAFNMGSEAFEEAYQFVAGEEAAAKATQGTEMFGEGFGKRLNEYVKDPEFQVSALLGAAMGGLFDFIGGPVTDKGIIPAKDRALLEIDRYNAKKMRASFLGDTKAFNEADEKISNNLIAKNLIAGRLDKLSTELDLFAQQAKENPDIDESGVAEIDTKVNKIKKEIALVQEEDRKLQQQSDKYRTNKKLRNAYILAKLDHSQVDKKISDGKKEYDRLVALDTDPRDKVFRLEMEIDGLNTHIRQVSRAKDLTDTQKEKATLEAKTKLEIKKNEIKSITEQIKTEDPSYDPKEYSNGRGTELTKVITEVYKNSLIKKQLASFIRQVEELNDGQAVEEEAKLNKETQENIKKDTEEGTKTVVSNSTTVTQTAKAANNAPGGKEAVTQVAKDKGIVSNVVETGSTSPVELGKEIVFTPIEATPVTEKVTKGDVVADKNGSTYEVVGKTIDNKSKKVTQVQVKDSQGNTQYLPAKDLNYVGKFEERDVQTSTESGLMDISKVYSKDGIEVDENKVAPFVAHMIKISEDLNKLFGDVKDPVFQNTLAQIDPRNLEGEGKLKLISDALKALQANEEFGGGVKNYLNNFFKDIRSNMDTVTVLAADPVPETELSGEELEQSQSEMNSNRSKESEIVAEHWHFQYEHGATKKDENRNPIEAEPRIHGEGYSKETTVRPDVGAANSEVSLQIDLDLPYNKKLIETIQKAKSPKELQEAIDTFINMMNIYISQEVDGKMVPLSVLRSPNRPSALGPSLKNRALREAVYQNIKDNLSGKGVLDTGISTKVTKKFGDTMNNRPDYVTPDDFYNSLPDIFKPEGRSTPIMGVVKKNNGVTSVHIPNLPQYRVQMNINLPVGSVVMIIKDSSGNLVPIYTPTKKIRELSQKVSDKFFTQIETLVNEILDPNADPKEVEQKISEIQSIAYIPIRRIKKGKGYALVVTKNQSFNLRRLYDQKIGKQGFSHTGAIDSLASEFMDVYTREEVVSIIEGNKTIEKTQFVIESSADITSPEFREFFGELRVQVDKKYLNATKTDIIDDIDYNQTIFDEGRIVTNLNPAMPFHSPMFELSENFSTKEAVTISQGNTKTKVSKPKKNKPATPKGITPEEANQGTISIEDLTGVDLKDVSDSEIESNNPVKPEAPSSNEEDLKKIKKDIDQLSDEYGDIDFDPFNLREATEEVSEQIDLEKELEWLNKVLPVGEEEGQIRLEVSETILRIGDKVAWGYFSNNLIKIFKDAQAGTVYHEAFHAVFNMALSPRERRMILRQTKAKYKIDDEIQLEERLAEEFVDFVMNNGSSTTVMQKPMGFFKRLWYMFTNRLDRNYDIQALYSRINSGQYKNAKFENNRLSRLSEAKDISMNLLTDLQKVERINNVTSFMTMALNRRMNLPENAGKDKMEVLKELGNKDEFAVEILLKEALLMINGYKKMLISKGKLTDDIDFQIKFMLSQTFTLSEGKHPEGHVNLKLLGREAVRQFAHIENLFVRFDNGEEVNGIDQSTEEDVYEKDEEINKVEHWQIELMQLSRKDGAPSEVRRELSYIKMLDNKGKDIPDSIGLPKYIPFAQTFATLIREVSDTNTAEKMLEAIKKLSASRSEYKSIYDKLQSDRDLLTKFFAGLQNSHADIKSLIPVRNSAGEIISFSWSSDNKNRIENVISTTWKSSLYDPNFADAGLVEWLDKIREQVEEEAIALKKEFSESNLAKRLAQEFKDAAFSQIKNEDDYAKVAAILNKFGIDILPREIKDMGKDYDKFYKWLQPVVADILKGNDPYASNLQAVSEAIKVYKTFKDDLFESSYQNIEGKTQYAHIKMGFLVKHINDLKSNPAILASFKEDPIYQYLDWIRDLEKNPEFAENFNYALVGGIKDENDQGTAYSDMTPDQLDMIRLNAFFNNAKEGWAYYMVPTLADSPSGMFIQARRLTNTEAIDSTIRILLGERNRVENARTNNSPKDVQSYSDNSSKYIMFPELAHLHDQLGDVKTNISEIRKEVKNYLENQVEIELKRLEQSGLIEKNKDGKYISNNIASAAFKKEENMTNRYDDAADFVRSYVYNSIPATAQSILLFSGDPAMYKNVVDFYKRQKQVWTPVTRLDTTAEFALASDLQAFHGGISKSTLNGTYTGIYITDIEEFSLVGEEILNVYLKAGYGTEAYKIAGKLGYTNAFAVSYREKDELATKTFTDKAEADAFAKKKTNKKFKAKAVPISLDSKTGSFYPSSKISLTDGQTMIHPRRYRDIQIGVGKWNSRREREYQKMMRLEKSNDDFQTIKPFTFGFRDHKNIKLPYQHKNSEYTLIPQVAYLRKDGTLSEPDTSLDKAERYKDYVAPFLAELYYTMDNYSDTAHFGSVVKVGLTESVDINALETVNDAKIIHFNNSDYGLIQETPAHYTDDEGNAGVQLRKLIIADLPSDFKTTINGTVYKREDIIKFWQDLVSADVMEDYETIEKEFHYDTEAYERGDFKSYNEAIARIRKLIINSLRDRNKGVELEKAFEIITDPDTGKNRFAIPLFDPIHAKTTEALLGATLRNKIVKQKAPGGSLVQVSSVGFHKDLSIKFNEDGSVAYYEAALPFWSKKHIEAVLDSNGNVDISKITDPKILELVGYRIPTEGKYSMIPMRVKRFLPREQGGTILLPLEITAITGSDFDIDKLYIMVQSFKTVKIDREKFKKELNKAIKTNPELKTISLSRSELDIILDQIENGEQALSEEELPIYDFYTENIEKFGKFELQRIKYDHNKEPKDNSRTARDNAKLDVIWSILTNPSTNDQLLSPGENSAIKELANEMVKKRDISDNLGFLSPGTSTKMFERNMTGANLIGIFANHNVNHAITQHSELAMIDSFVMNGVTYKELNRVHVLNSDNTESKDTISGNIAMFLRAILDNAKDPISSFINLNSFTSDVYALLLRLGLPMQSAVYFMNQPAVVGLYTLYNKYGQNTAAYKKGFSQIESALKKQSNGIVSNMLTDNIKNHIGQRINTNTNVEFAADQLRVLQEFDKLYNTSKSLGKIVQVFKADDTRRQITSANNEVFKMNIDEVKKYEDKVFTGIGDLFEKYPMMETFRQTAVYNSSEILHTHFPFDTPIFNQIKKNIAENLLGFKRLSAKQMEEINLALLDFMISKFQFFNPNKPYKDTNVSELEHIVKNFPTEFTKMKKDHPEIATYSIINHIEFLTKDRAGAPFNRLRFRKTGGLSGYDTDRVVRDWRNLLNHENAEIREFAQNLIKYTYYVHGSGIEADTFTQFIPVEWRAFLKEDGPNGLSYRDFLENSFEASKNLSRFDEFENFIMQFYQHNFFNKFYVERMDKDVVDKMIKNKRLTVLKNEPAFMEIHSEKDMEFVRKRGKVDAKTFIPAEFLQYISVEYKGKVYLMKAVSKNGVHDTESNFIMEYKVINVKGRKGVIKEYDFAKSGYEPSLIKSNNALNANSEVVSVSTPATTTTQQPISTIETFEGKWTRDKVEQQTDKLFIFTDNTDRNSGSGIISSDSWYAQKYGEGKHFPTMTTAVIRGLDNARPISTQRWYNATNKGVNGRWQDADIQEFKKVIDAEFSDILDAWNTGKYKAIVFPAGDGLFNAQISAITEERTPQLYAYLQNKYNELVQQVTQQSTLETQDMTELNMYGTLNTAITDLISRIDTYQNTLDSNSKEYKSLTATKNLLNYTKQANIIIIDAINSGERENMIVSKEVVNEQINTINKKLPESMAKNFIEAVKSMSQSIGSSLETTQKTPTFVSKESLTFKPGEDLDLGEEATTILSKNHETLLENYDLLKGILDDMGISSKEMISALTSEEVGKILKKFCK